MSPTWRGVWAYPWRLIFLLSTGLGFFFFLRASLADLARQEDVAWFEMFLEEMTGAYSSFSLSPLIAWLVLRYPIAGRWRSRLPLYAAAAVVYAVLDTTLMYLLRLAAFALAGRGVYDYGVLAIRYFMEMPLQVILFATIAMVITFTEERRAGRGRQQRLEALERELTQAQLQTLQFQLQPHFLFNAFNAISAVMYENPRAADRMIGRLGDFLRAVLRTNNSQEVSLSEELQLVDLYVDVMKARFEDNIQCRVTHDGGIESAMVPQLLLQPVVENAIRYGVNPENGKIDVSVKACKRGSDLELEVTDQGTGEFDEPGGLGVGLKNISARLERLYGRSARLSIERQDHGGTRVLITVPFHLAPVQNEA